MLAETALQRSLPHDVLARVFGAFHVLLLLAILVGSGLATAAISWWGLDVAIWLAGAGVFALSLVGVPWLVGADRVARARRAQLTPVIGLLERCDLIEHVADGDLTQLASAARPVAVFAGAVVVGEGEAADAFFVVVSGRLTVASRATSTPIPDLVAGDYFGEIGLIEKVPRTATVTAGSDVELLGFPGEALLEALTVYRPSVAIMDAAAVRLHRTHPASTLRRAGLEDEEVA